MTEEFHPGFRNSTASYTVSLLNPKVIADLDLARHGLQIVERPIANFLPLSAEPGAYLKVGGGLAATQAEVARYSQRDAERLPAYYAMLEEAAQVLRELALETPPNVGGGLAEILPALKAMNSVNRLSLPAKRNLLALFANSAGDLLDAWFESAPLKAAFGFDAVVGNFASPYAPGSAYVLLHHVFGEVNGKPGQWGHAIGGMGAISEAMAAEARLRGVTHRLRCRSREAHGQGRAGDGRGAEGRARNRGARGRGERESETVVSRSDRAAAHRAGFSRAHAKLPLRVGDAAHERGPVRAAGLRLPARGGNTPSIGDHHGALARLHGTGLVRCAQRRHGQRSPSSKCSSRARWTTRSRRRGAHVASLFCQHFNPAPADGKSWDELREAAADRVIDTVNGFAPNFRASVLGRMTLTPLDLERRFGLTGGDIFHGALSLDQLFSARPVLGNANYRMPLAGLYLCGSGAHPGGGVTGLPGHNAAREIVRDFRRGRVR